MLISKHQN